MSNKGRLYLVGTPIGNLGDITLRALEILKEAEVVLCEDTRRAQKLFHRYSIETPRVSFHDFNKEQKTSAVLKKIKEGAVYALISDAGTPGISDPGFYLAREALRCDLDVISIPGPSAFLTALVASGLATDRFTFEGFLPRRNSKRKQRLEALREDSKTIIFYESPHRIEKLLRDILEIIGDRDLCLARELTKLHEELLRCKTSELLKRIECNQVRLKGEMVLLLEGSRGL
ncbi:MAG: 16S rRNA (cytidine(1402)-2'-O)-methyltransferase [Candidatus Kaelpia imicola]|nr:16S rRNA (cytidine(1402)-2'-O)-methyltransferase [Candidatus Kaelpia imicola]